MGSEVDKKFTWVIKNFSSLQSKNIYSDPFIIGGCKWNLLACPKGGRSNTFLSVYLTVSDRKSLPSGWRRRIKFRLKVVNQVSEELSQSQLKEMDKWFDPAFPAWGATALLPLTELHDRDRGFLVNGELKIVADIVVLEVIGKLDVSEEAEEATNPQKKTKLNDDGAVSTDLLIKTQQLNERIDVNGFQVFPSQVESVRHIFERHPEFASEFRTKNRHLKSTYMNVLLGLIETLCQLPEELSDDDLDEASVAFEYVAKGGFKLDWLETKLEELKAKKNKVDTGKVRQQQIEEELQKLNQKCLDLKALLEKENEEVLVAKVRFSFDDVV